MVSAPDKNNIVHKGLSSRQLVLFDFDGTITTKDTLAEFLIYFHGKTRYLLGLALLSPIMAAYIFKVMPNWKSKQYLLTWFLKNENVDSFNKRCAEFSKRFVPHLVRQEALEAIRNYQASGATVAVVSASAENWVKPWCDEQNLLCLATKLEVKNNSLTGKIEGRNCHGAEKVSRIKEKFNLADYEEIIAYGDTSGDREMLALAHQQHYKPFRK